MEQERRDQTKPDSILASSNEVLQYIEEGKYPPQSDRTMPLWWISLILSIMEKMDTHRHGQDTLPLMEKESELIVISILLGKQKKHIDDFYLCFAKNHPIISF